ncbi:TFIIE alpha subunit-domain-containing protein [Schizophyllum amplum]|uniref:TFIIE alpha subunit-domain-containing protein n=1 Tax=Schizophyllum amplum TaxID=97359 RepID=A0A550CGD1_9AGAR|nr:TFIIE alpha subunit-domain-containing protein [Auriculariopsis ampla]
MDTAPAPTASEIQRVLKRLVQYVARTFYEPKHIVMMDLLVRNPVVKDDELAGMMDMKLKDVQKIAADLANASLIKMFRQNELKDGAQRASPKTYYYIDYIHFCNVVKWRVWRMQKKIDSSTRNELENKGYLCTQCGQTYTALEVDKVLDFLTGELICDACKGPVVEHEGAGAEGGNTRLQRFNQQIHLITSGLRRVDEAGRLPGFDVAAHVKAAHVDTARGKNEDSSGLRIAGSSGAGAQDAAVGIVLADAGDEAARRAARDAAADARRQQNALPAWHLRSTVSGGLTALGVAEREREERERGEREAMMNGANGNTASSAVKEEDPLSGFGVVGAPRNGMRNGRVKMEDADDGVAMDMSQGSAMQMSQGSAPAAPAAADLDMWYAGVGVGGDPGPAGYGATPFGGAPDPYGDDPEDDDDDGPRFATSLSAWRKRSREEEEEELNGPPSKSARVNGDGYPVKAEPGESDLWGDPSATANAYNDGSMDVDMAGGDADDPIVYVQGKPLPYSGVTEDLYETMTEEETNVYVEIMQTRGM